MKNYFFDEKTEQEVNDDQTFISFGYYDFFQEFHIELKKSADKDSIIETFYKNLTGWIKILELKGRTLAVESYIRSYDCGSHIDETQRKYTGYQLALIDLGKLISKCQRHLDFMRIQLAKSNPKSNKIQLTVKEVVYILDNLGLLNQLNFDQGNQAISFFLAGIMNRNPQDIRECLGQLPTIKSKTSKNGLSLTKANEILATFKKAGP